MMNVVQRAVAEYFAEHPNEDRDPDKFYPLPNRASRRRSKFGGQRVLIWDLSGEPVGLVKPLRSRIQRLRRRRKYGGCK